MEPSIHFHTLGQLVDAEDVTREKICTLHLTIEINNVTSKLKSQKLSCETYDLNPEVIVTQKTHPNNRSKPRFWN